MFAWPGQKRLKVQGKNDGGGQKLARFSSSCKISMTVVLTLPHGGQLHLPMCTTLFCTICNIDVRCPQVLLRAWMLKHLSHKMKRLECTDFIDLTLGVWHKQLHNSQHFTTITTVTSWTLKPALPTVSAKDANWETCPICTKSHKRSQTTNSIWHYLPLSSFNPSHLWLPIASVNYNKMRDQQKWSKMHLRVHPLNFWVVWSQKHFIWFPKNGKCVPTRSISFGENLNCPTPRG